MNDTNLPLASLDLEDFGIFKVLYERTSNHKQYQMQIAVNHITQELTEKEHVGRFQSIFNIEVSSKDAPEDEKNGPAGGLTIHLEARGFFKIGNVTDEEVRNNYFNVSAPSIVFPYIRTFLANFSAMTGINAVTLPLVAFRPNGMEEQK